MENYNYFSQQFQKIQDALKYGDPDGTLSLKELVYEMLETIKQLEETQSKESQKKGKSRNVY